MSAAAFELQRTIYNALIAGPAIAGGRVYDDVPENAAFPHVEIGERQIIPDDTNVGAHGEASDDGVSDFIDLHIWSRYRGDKEVLEIFNTIHTRLHGVSLLVAGRAGALSWVRNFRSFNDPDGQTRHGVVSVEIRHRS